MSKLNEYIIEELQERSGNDLAVYKDNSDTALGINLNTINDFRFGVHQKYLDMITSELLSISPNMDKEIISQISKYNFDKLNFTVTNLNEEHIKSFNFKYLVNYCRMVETLLNNTIKNKVDDRAILELLTDSTVFKLEKQTVIGTVRYGKDLAALKESLEYSTVKVDNLYFDGTVVPFINSFKANQAECRKIISEYSKTVSIMQGFVDKLIDLCRENKATPFTNDKIVHKIIIKSLRIIDKVSGFVTFCVLIKAQELVSKVISIQGLYNDMLNSNIIATEGFNGNIIFPIDTHSLADDMINGHCGAFLELSNHIYSYYTLKNDATYQLMYNDMYDEPEKDRERRYNNAPYVDIVNAIGNISKGLDRIGKEGDQYLMMFDDVLKESGLNLSLRAKYKNELEMLANSVEQEPPMLDTDNVDRKLWELIGFKKNVEALTGLVADTQKKILILLERFGNNVNSEYKDLDTINSYKVFLSDFLDTYKDFINDVCGALITRLNNLNDSLEKSTEELAPNYSAPAVTDSQLSYESVDFLDIVFSERAKGIEEDFRCAFIALENEYITQKYLRDTGYQLVIEETPGTTTTTTDNGNTNGGTQPSVNSSGNGTQDKQTQQPNQNQQNSNQNQQNADKTKVQVNDGNKPNSPKSADSLKGMIQKIIDKIIEMFKSLAQKMAMKNDKWIKENKAALLGRSYANVTVNILPYHAMNTTSFADGIKKLTTNINGLTAQTLKTIADENALYGKLFSFIQGGVNTQKGDLGMIITNYYKVGNNKLETVEVANGALKSQIDGEMIPYCENYPHQFIDTLTQDLDGLKTTAAQQIVKLIDADTDNTLGEKIQWINNAVGKFCGGLCNAARDRYTDYFKVLYSLLPKTVTPNNNDQNNNNNQNNNQNNQPNNNQNNQVNNQGDQNNVNNNNGNQG